MGYDMRFADGTPGDEGYFRLNITGMRIFRDYMAERGMVFDAGDPPQPPSWDDEPAVLAWQSWHGPEIPGIPVHKFCSNDSWLVLPAECEAALRAAHQHSDPPEHADYWRDWLDYLDRARSHGGLVVR